MSAVGRGFDRLARSYRFLEYLAFAGDLERARFAFLGRLAGCRDILLLGEGDGRCAERVAQLAPEATILCVDSSPGMIRRASIRYARHAGRVRFLCAVLRSLRTDPGRFDAVATLFVLDCLDDQEVRGVVSAVGASLRPGSPWLFADFVLPPRGVARLRARAWLAVLYAFFRWQAGLTVSALPASEAILAQAGWHPSAQLELQRGLLRSAVLERVPASPAGH